MDTQSMSAASDEAGRLIAFIQHNLIRNGAPIDADTPLVSSGLIDSLALIDIFLQLETITRRKIPGSKVRAKDMDTVNLMLSMADRLGTPKGRGPEPRP